MGTRDELGAANVSDAQLAAMVADLLHEDTVELLDWATGGPKPKVLDGLQRPVSAMPTADSVELMAGT